MFGVAVDGLLELPERLLEAPLPAERHPLAEITTGLLGRQALDFVELVLGIRITAKLDIGLAE